MRTDDLIRAIAADVAPMEPPVESRLARAIAAGLLVTVALLVTTLGVRQHFLSLLLEPRITFKFVVTLALAIPACLVVARLARPGTTMRGRAWALALAPTLLAMAILGELLAVPSSTWETRLVGNYPLDCLACVPLLSLPLLVAALVALRHGAPTRPALTGAIAGLLAGGLGAAVYALHCPDDSPLFVAAWYSLAIGIVALLGGVTGSRILRW